MQKNDETERTIVIDREDILSKTPPVPMEEKKKENSFTGHFDAGELTRTAINRTATFFTPLQDVDQKIDENDRQFLSRSKLDLDPSSMTDQQLPPLDASCQTEPPPLAEGGQAIISKGRDKHLRRIIAVKTLRSELRDKPDVRKDFLAEAQLTSQLEHPAIIPIYSVNGDDESNYHITMKLIRGKTLKLRLTQIAALYKIDGIRKYDEGKSVFLRLERFLNICSAIAYAHSKGILHCDLKPENIMIGEYNETYVMDWGIARPILHVKDPDARITTRISGTPRYISPEAILGKTLDERSDIYSLGLILFEMVTLDSAVPGDTPKDAMCNIRDGNINPIRHKFRWKIPADLEAIIRKATETDRKNRYSSVTELSDDIRRFLNHSEVRANPDTAIGKCFRWVWHHVRLVTILGLAVMLALSGVAAYFFYQQMLAEEGKNVIQSTKGLAFGNATLSAFTLEKAVLKLEESLKGIAITARLLNSADQPIGNLPEDYAFDQKLHFHLPKEMKYSEAYGKEIGLGGSSFKPASGNDAEKTKKQLTNFHVLDTFSRATLFESNPENLADTPAQRERFIRKYGAPIRKILIGLEDGFYAAYPATRDSGKNYDPRKRIWYRDAMQNKKTGVLWIGPYLASNRKDSVMTCSIPLTDERNRRIGVAAFDVSTKFFEDALRRKVSGERLVEEKMLLDFRGNIVMHSNPRRQVTLFEGGSGKKAIRIVPFPQRDLFTQIDTCADRGGIIIRQENDAVKGYVFFKLSHLPFYYLEKINFGKLAMQFSTQIGKNGKNINLKKLADQP